MIDQCQHTFIELATTILPADMELLRASISRPIPMTTFAGGKVTAIKKIGRARDFAGCYAVIDGTTPFYVGISRGVVGRLMNHCTGRTHFQATLAYKMACGIYEHKLSRNGAMADTLFMTEFVKAKERIRGMNVGFVEIENPLERHLFEAFASMELKTGQFNTFETH